MFRLFNEGGVLVMTVMTVELICMLFAAWKAPAWVKEIGLLALATGLFFQFFSIYYASGVLQQTGDVSLGLLAGAYKLSLIKVMYGILIYALSLVIRMVQKPKI